MLAPDSTAAAETRIALQEVLRGRDREGRLAVLRAIVREDVRERVTVAVLRPASGEPTRTLRLQPLEGPDPEGGFPLPSVVYGLLEEMRLQLASGDAERRAEGLRDPLLPAADVGRLPASGARGISRGRTWSRSHARPGGGLHARGLESRPGHRGRSRRRPRGRHRRGNGRGPARGEQPLALDRRRGECGGRSAGGRQPRR